MTDKVQKIKEWISKTQDGLMDAQGNFEYSSDEGAFNVLSKLDYYIDSLQEEPVSKEIGNYNHKAVMEALHPELKEEPVSEDLGEYINELSKQFPEVSFAKLSRIAVRVAKWQKEQLIKEAIDGIARPDDDEVWCDLKSFNFKDGDKLKVIIIKED